MTPKEEGLAQVRRCLDEVRADRRARRRRLLRIHARAAIHRFLPRPARAVHFQDQSVQAALDRRRVLERQRAQQATAAHLRHRILYARRSWTSTCKRLEEAKKRDHRKLGKELDLFSIQELAGPGLIFFHPKGGTIRKLIEDWMRDQYLKRGYSLVYTPHVARVELWKTSGHAEFLCGQHVHAHGAGRRRIPAQADELSRPYSDLCATGSTVIAICRCGWASSAPFTVTSARA